MLNRVLEPEVMDSQEEARDYDAMDHAAVNHAFAQDFLATAAPAGRVLDLGCGTAQIPIELATLEPNIEVLAVDLAPAMLAVARQNIERAGLADRIETGLVDAKQLPFAEGRFAAVISNSIVHHIPEPASVLAEAVRVCAGGGRIFFRDLLRPDDALALEQLVETYAGDENDHQRKMFADSLRAALRVEEMQALVAELGFSKESVAQTTDRHWTWSAVKA